MDISSTTQAKSDQQNYDDYAGGIVRIVTISEVRKGSAEQPVEIHLVEFPGKPFKPAKTVRRVLVAAWGADSSVYAGRRMELYGDPTVKWAGQAVGGIRVSALSDIDKPLKVMLSESKGKRVPVTVQPLPDAPPQQPTPTPADVAACTDLAALRDMYARSSPDVQGLILKRKDELSATETTEEPS